MVLLPRAAQMEICQDLERKAARLHVTTPPDQFGTSYAEADTESADAAYALSILMSIGIGIGGSYDLERITKWLVDAARGGCLQAAADLPRVLAALGREISPEIKGRIMEPLGAAVALGYGRFVRDTLAEYDPVALREALSTLSVTRSSGRLANPCWDSNFTEAMTYFWEEYARFHGRNVEYSTAAAAMVAQELADVPSLTEFVQHLLVSSSSNDTVYPGGLSLLHLTANLGVTDLMATVLSSPGYHVDMADEEGRTALYYSAVAGNAALANHLLDQGATPWELLSGSPNYNHTSLHFITRFERQAIPDLVRRFVETSADVNAQHHKSMETPLHMALKDTGCGAATVSCATIALLNYGADPTAKDKDEDTPMAWAAINLQVDMLELLLSRLSLSPEDMAELAATLFDSLMNTPELDRLVYGGEQYQQRMGKMLRMLLNKESWAAYKLLEDGGGQSPFFSAVQSGHLDLALAMIHYVPSLVDPDEPDDRGRPILRYAIRNRTRYAVETLVASMGASLRFADPEGENAFHVAAEYYPELLPYLLEKMQGAGTPIITAMLTAPCGRNNFTPFDKAVVHGHLDAARLLASYQVDLDGWRIQRPVLGEVGLASILGAILSRSTTSRDQVAFLLNMGASPATMSDGSTVFHSLADPDSASAGDINEGLVHSPLVLPLLFPCKYNPTPPHVP